MSTRLWHFALGAVAQALTCLAGPAMANCQLPPDVLAQSADIGAFIKDGFAAIADKEIGLLEGEGAVIDLVSKLASGPDFAEAFVHLDSDLKGIGSTIFDEIKNIGLINNGYTALRRDHRRPESASAGPTPANVRSR
jgi:hypothetical protein